MTQMIYEVQFDGANEKILEMKVTTLCASKPVDGKAVSKEEMLTTQPHIAFSAVYRFSQLGEVERFDVPAGAMKAMR